MSLTLNGVFTILGLVHGPREGIIGKPVGSDPQSDAAPATVSGDEVSWSTGLSGWEGETSA